MLRHLALLICILFMLYLFWMDLKKSDGPSNALWIPLVWMFLAGSRYVSSWLNLGAPPLRSVDSYSQGSPVDAVVFFFLIAAGVFILSRRRIDWGRLVMQNKWIWLYFLYCGISIIWSDYPFISFKRWIKELGNPIMILVILTEKRPYEAVGVILRRLSFLMLPLSVLFIKYYPDLGRAYFWGGQVSLTGIGHQKNDLGLICLMSGIYYSWNFLLNRKGDFKFGGRDNIIDFMLIGMGVWLLYKAQSATSLACLVVAMSLFFMGCTTLVARRPGRIVVLLMIVVSLFLFLEATLDVRDSVIRILGRDPSLTHRTITWDVVRGMVVNPLVGVGYQSFWLGERLEIIWEKLGAHFIQAHNGYLEQYLNLGLVGVAFIGGIILSGLLKVRKYLYVDYPAAMLRLCFIVTAVLYNYTEAAFYGINNIWLLLLLGVIEISDQQRPYKESVKLRSPSRE
jgi:exopolysaccharide production protein ExoQ